MIIKTKRRADIGVIAAKGSEYHAHPDVVNIGETLVARYASEPLPQTSIAAELLNIAGLVACAIEHAAQADHDFIVEVIITAWQRGYDAGVMSMEEHLP